MAKTLGGFDSKHPDFDKLKYIRQLRGVVKWKQSLGKGSIVWATGVGKSSAPIIAYNKMIKKLSVKIVVVVPTNPLKLQWERELEKNGIRNYKVYVINTTALNSSFKDSCDLLVLDETHLFASEQFRNVFDNITYRWLMPLTATPNRKDGEEHIIFDKAPICDYIPQKEAIEKGWISDFIVFNLAVPVTRSESMKLSQYNKNVALYMRRFGGFEEMQQCMSKFGAEQFIKMTRGSTYNPTNTEITSVIKDAVQGMSNIRARKTFLDNTEHKINAAKELIEELDVKTIVFSQSTDFADNLTAKLDKAMVYHSNVKPKMVYEFKSKHYKTDAGASKFLLKLRKEGIEAKYDLKTKTVNYKKAVKYGTKRLRDLAIDSFINNKITRLISAKALDQGFDKKDIILGVDASRTGNPGQCTQRTGRVARNYYIDKIKAIKIMVYLYVPNWSVPNSSDEKKLIEHQQNLTGVNYVDDLDELKDKLKELLIDRDSEYFTKNF